MIGPTSKHDVAPICYGVGAPRLPIPELLRDRLSLGRVIAVLGPSTGTGSGRSHPSSSSVDGLSRGRRQVRCPVSVDTWRNAVIPRRSSTHRRWGRLGTPSGPGVPRPGPRSGGPWRQFTSLSIEGGSFWYGGLAEPVEISSRRSTIPSGRYGLLIRFYFRIWINI